MAKNDLKQRLFNRIARVKTNLIDVFSYGESYQLSHDKLLDRLDRVVYSQKDWTLLPAYQRAYFSGYIDARFERNWQMCTWMHIDPSSQIAYPGGYSGLDYRKITVENWQHGNAWGKIAEPVGVELVKWYTLPQTSDEAKGERDDLCSGVEGGSQGAA